MIAPDDLRRLYLSGLATGIATGFHQVALPDARGEAEVLMTSLLENEIFVNALDNEIVDILEGKTGRGPTVTVGDPWKK